MLWLNFSKTWKQASTFFVHVALIGGVALYTVFGALSIQWLESPERVRAVIKRDIPSNFPQSSSPPKTLTRVYLGEELAIIDPEVHRCLENTIFTIFHETQCDGQSLERLNIELIDRCYSEAKVPYPVEFLERETQAEVVEVKIEEEAEERKEEEVVEKWSIGNSVIFAFTVITTIGYGHVAPETFEGRLFLIIYGLIGVPFTLLTIADLGMFLTKFLRFLLRLARKFAGFLGKCYQKIAMKLKKGGKTPSSNLTPKTDPEGAWSTGREIKVQMKTARELGDAEMELEEKEEVEKVEEKTEEESEQKEEDQEPRKSEESIALMITFTCYLFAGAKILSVYEPEMDFFKALYFNFVTLTTVGLGDFVPKSFDYLLVTLIYIGIGLALTTMAIEIAADLLKKLHYIGRKMENVGSAVVWFGGKKMTMKALVKHLGDQFNIPEAELANFDMSQFVDDAIKVEKGEIATLRKPATPTVVFRERAFSYSNIRKSSESALKYVDDSRFSKLTEPSITTAPPIPESTRTTDTLHNLSTAGTGRGDTGIPRLDLDVTQLTDMSAPTSFDENYLRTYSIQRRK
uniref:Potassium channel domain-containing protein n=1 Tax=Caenorhabditis japonica TaxID=281687 RepID=A0A8R1I912_CAEJA